MRRHPLVALALAALMLCAVASIGLLPAAFAQSPTVTPIVLEPRDVLTGALDSLATFVAGATPTETVPFEEPTPTATAIAEASPTVQEVASATATSSPEASATETSAPTPSVAVAEPTMPPSTATVPPISPTPEPVEENPASSGTTLLIAGGIGILALAGAVLWRRR